MKVAFLYAGQGTQHPGMGRDLYETYPAFRSVFESAKVDFDLEKVCFEGPDETLNQTQYTQPCMVAFATRRDGGITGEGRPAFRDRRAQPGRVLCPARLWSAGPGHGYRAGGVPGKGHGGSGPRGAPVPWRPFLCWAGRRSRPAVTRPPI